MSSSAGSETLSTPGGYRAFSEAIQQVSHYFPAKLQYSSDLSPGRGKEIAACVFFAFQGSGGSRQKFSVLTSFNDSAYRIHPLTYSAMRLDK